MTTVAPPPDVLVRYGMGADAPAVRLDAGHIHRSWFVDGPRPAVVQRVNTAVFRDLEALDANLSRLEVLLVARGVPTVRWRRDPAGSLLHQDDEGRVWRAYDWLPGEMPSTSSMPEVEAVGAAFGRFAGALAEVAPGHFATTIPAFHDFAARERAWRFAVLRDDVHRFSRAQPEVERAAGIVERLHALEEFATWAQLPPRVVHNDAKATNLVRSGAVHTVIDLDTTMPGPLLADLGELVRTICRTAPEDDDRSANALQTERFGLLLRGWLDGYGRELHEVEARVVPIAGIVLTVESALRFLTDYLEGDLYFPVDSAEHNRTRFRAQIGHAQVLLDGINDLRRVAAHELQRRR